MAKVSLTKLPKRSTAVGVSGGTGFAGLVMLMPDSSARSVLLILAPAITALISSLWVPFTQEVDMRVADWRIASQRKQAQRRYDALISDGIIDQSVIAKAKLTLDALTLLEIEIAHRRAEAIIS